MKRVVAALLVSILVGCSLRSPQPILKSKLSPDKLVEAITYRTPDEGGLGGGTAFYLAVRARGSKDDQIVLLWEPWDPKQKLTFEWEGNRKLAVTITGGKISHYSNEIVMWHQSSGETVSVRLDAPYFDE